MTYFAIVAGIILLWMFLAPKEVGKWLSQVQEGYDAHSASLEHETASAEKEKM